MLGALLITPLGDKFGRKKVLNPILISLILSSLGLYFGMNMWLILTLLCLFGLGHSTQVILAYLHGMEHLPQDRKLYFHITKMITESALTFLLTVTVSQLGNLRYLYLINVGFLIILFSILQLFFDTPRYYMARGRYEQARRAMDNISTINMCEEKYT